MGGETGVSETPVTYGITTIVDAGVDETVHAVKDALAEQGFGVITEIDLAATLKAKLDADVPPHVILGACSPPLALRAVQAEASIGLLLPCNVVVRATKGGTIVQAIDPELLVEVTGNRELREVAEDAAARLRSVVASLD